MAAVAVMLVSIVGCAASHSSSTAPTSTLVPATGSSVAPANSLPRPAADAASLCATAYGAAVVESAATDVRTVRKAGIGIVGGMFKKAFPGVNDDAFAAWCMLRTTAHCYDEAAVAVNGVRRRIVNAGCGWPAGPPVRDRQFGPTDPARPAAGSRRLHRRDLGGRRESRAPNDAT